MQTNNLFQLTEAGLYCAAGDFYIDPWRPVERAVVTHAHGDHAYRGHKRYLIAAEGLNVTVVNCRFLKPYDEATLTAYRSRL